MIGPLLTGVRGCALLDFPQHGNVGDSAIWLGERAFLRAGAARVTYLCDLRSFSPDLLRSRPAEEPILLHGGGNLGDLYPRHQQLREDLLAAFPDRRVVQLPQTIRFGEPAALERARRAFGRHRHLTLLVRDEESLDLARRCFDVPSHLCPDMAFALGPLQQVREPEHDVLWLARTDHERGSDPPALPPGVHVTDWLTEPRRPLAARLWRRIAPRPAGPLAAQGLLALADPLARARLERGTALLGSGRVVVTDRLHGHILSILLGIPHVVLGDRHGKVRNFREAWTRDCDLVRWAASPAEALELAAGALSRGGR